MLATSLSGRKTTLGRLLGVLLADVGRVLGLSVFPYVRRSVGVTDRCGASLRAAFPVQSQRGVLQSCNEALSSRCSGQLVAGCDFLLARLIFTVLSPLGIVCRTARVVRVLRLGPAIIFAR